MNFQERAKEVLKQAAILPLAAASTSAASLSLDFAGTGLYDNSGFFASTVTPKAGVGGSAQGLGFKLYGSDSLSDSAFYRFDEFENESRPIFDGDGLGFLWGGAVNGSFEAGDRIVAPYEFGYDFTFTPAFPGDDYVNNTWSLTIGLVEDYGSGINFAENFSASNAYKSETYYGDTQSAAGSFDLSGTLEMELGFSDVEFHSPRYWFVLLSVLVDHENAAGDFEPPFPKWNGDVLNVTVPQNSIDIEVIPINPVPEPSVALLALTAFSVFSRRKRS